MRWLAVAGLLFLACGPPSGGDAGAPYGFDAHPVQAFALESTERLDIDGEQAEVIRFAAFELRVTTEGARADSPITHVDLYLDRYYQSVKGAPGGPTELAISERGLTSQTDAVGRVHLAPNDEIPGAGKVRYMREDPMSSVGLRADGSIGAAPWHTQHPFLLGIDVLEWFMLAVPRLGDADEAFWRSERPLPRLGQYALGATLEQRVELAPGSDAGLRVYGSLVREDIELAVGLRGRLQLDQSGDVQLDAAGRALRSTSEVRLDFRNHDGSVIRATHRLTLECTSCDGAVNSEPELDDTPPENARVPQQGHLDDLPDHG